MATPKKKPAPKAEEPKKEEPKTPQDPFGDADVEGDAAAAIFRQISWARTGSSQIWGLPARWVSWAPALSGCFPVWPWAPAASWP